MSRWRFGDTTAKDAESGHEPKTRRNRVRHAHTSEMIETAAPVGSRLRSMVQMRQLGPADMWLTAVLIALVIFGVVMVYSASAVYAGRWGAGFDFLIRQSIFAVVGLAVMVLITSMDYRLLRHLSYPVLGVALLGFLVILLGGGHSVNGAVRWIRLGSINIQPAEFAKLAIVLWLSYSLSKKHEQIGSFSVGFLPHVLMCGVFMLFCLKQPDFGSALMIGVLTFVLLFVAGAKPRYLLGTTLLTLPVLYFLIVSSAYRLKRWNVFHDPCADRAHDGYQLCESLIAFGNGGVTGLGLGESRQKLLFLPEAHTDFISSIVGEEFGFVGICCLIVVFAFILYRGFRIAWRAADDFGVYLAIGATFFIGLQAFTNLAVAMGMVPTKGLTLPFVSYGGSSLLVNCAAAGMLLSVSRVRIRAANTRKEVKEVKKLKMQMILGRETRASTN